MKYLIKAALFYLLSVLVLIQRNEYGELLIEGHLALAVVCYVLAAIAAWSAIRFAEDVTLKYLEG